MFLHGHTKYKDLKGIALELAQKKFQLDVTIPLAHQAKYILNPNYVIPINQYINKLLVIGFIEFVEEATWLSPIVIVPKKNSKLKICINFKKIMYPTKGSIPITFHNEMLNTVVGYETYIFLDGYLGYHQISIALEDKYKIAFVID
jgi:hypothetical protein